MGTNGLIRRLTDLEARLPEPPCPACAARPKFTLGGEAEACPWCGAQPFVFTIDIDRVAGRAGDAA